MGSKLVAMFLSVLIIAGSLGINIPISYANIHESNINQDILISEKNVEDRLIVSGETELTTPSVKSSKSQNCFASGHGTEQEPYEIFTKEDLIFLSDRVNNGDSKYNDKCYRLMNEISLEDIAWIPIGTELNPFSGIFDGGDYFISNIRIDESGDSLESVGFFGYIKFGRVFDLNLFRVNIKSEYNSSFENKNIGALVGHIYGGGRKERNIKNVKVENVSICLDWNDNFKVVNVGGLSGLCEGITIEDSSSKLTMTDKKFKAGNDQAIGGFVGKLDNLSLVDRCESSGYVICNDGDFLGGFVGYNCGEIKNCYTDARPKFYTSGGLGRAQYTDTGGFVGKNEGNIENSCSTKNVIGSESWPKIGTFCGYNKARIINCYSIGEYEGEDEGAMIGCMDGGKVQYAYAPKSVIHIVEAHSIGKPDVSDSELMSMNEMTNNTLLEKLNKNIETEKKSDSWDSWYYVSGSSSPKTRKTYLTVTFFNSGDLQLPCQEVPYDKSIEEPSVKNAGDELEGWYTNRDYYYMNKWNFKDKLKNDLKLYAKWKGVNVTFNTDNDNVYLVKNFGKNKLITEPEKPQKIGYKFGGWYKDNGGVKEWEFYKDKVENDMTLYAKWIKTFNVNFDSDGGSEVNPQIIEKGQFLKIPQIPVKEGYIFNGMYKDKSFEKKWDFTKDLVDSDMTIYVKWDTFYSYKVKFDIDWGEIVKPPVYQRTGYIFGGWYKEKELVNKWDFKTDKLAKDTILYASWKKI